MRDYTPAIIRYSIGILIVVVTALDVLGILLLAIGLVHKIILQDSPPTVSTVFTVGAGVLGTMTSMPFLIVLCVTSVIGTIIGRKKYGSLSQFCAAVIKYTDGVLGYTLFDSPLVEGRIRHNGIAWRCQYWEDGHIDIPRRECPFCGLELVESYLPRHIVFEPNTTFDPGEESRETATEAWHDVFGEETAEDRDEVSALACPQCNFSVPGEKSVLEGKDSARAKFEQHIEIMKSGSSQSSPFGEYSEAASERVDGNPQPMSVWNEYVAESSSDAVLSIGVDFISEMQDQETLKQTSSQNAS